MLIRTTLRINENLKRQAEKKALQDDLTLQEIFNQALEDYLQNEAKKYLQENVGYLAVAHQNIFETNSF